MRAFVFLPALCLLLPACETASPASSSAPTYYQDVAPILAAKCVGCHVSGGIAPFPLDSYVAAGPMASPMVDAVTSGKMPPWGAEETDECTPPKAWKSDARLTDAEKQRLSDWADAGAPEGDAATAAALPTPPSLTLENPTAQIRPTSTFTPTAGTDVFMCYSFDPGFTQTEYLTGLQVVADETSVVHHVLVGIDSRGTTASDTGWYECSGGSLGGADQLIGAWAPGGSPLLTPDGTATQMDPGIRLVMQVHYHPAGATSFGPDATGFDMVYSETPPTQQAIVSLIGNASTEADGLLPGDGDPSGRATFKIPKDTAGHVETMEFPIPAGGPYSIFRLGTHMHYVGVDELVTVKHKDPLPNEAETECLIQTPHWDFNWQRSYQYDAPIADLPQLREGDTLTLRCTYDNVLTNPGVQQLLADTGETATHVVRLGETTDDEMCLIGAGLVLP